PAAGAAPALRLESRVAALYGDSIRALVRATLARLGAADLDVILEDTGALPYVLMARVEAAVKRLRPELQAAALPEISAPRAPTPRDRLRRSRLYLPGNTPKFFVNAGLHQPDAVILDLEDSVAAAEKDAARLLVRNALRAVNFYGAEVTVRVNARPAGLEDIRVLAGHGVQAFILPKVETAEEILSAAAAAGPVHLIPILESARGVFNALAIAEASPQVAAVSIGLEDYTADLGAARTPEGRESLWARSQVVNAARAAGVQPLASVYAEVDDLDGMRRFAAEARAFGFEGVACLHPRQVAAAHAGFRPGPDEVEQARRIVAALAEARAAGQGVVAVDGKMVDAPVALRAQRVLRLAEAP
ncbi:MAG: hypothetical protein KA764_18820, partial [Anaerolineales bacterium]|nr:hypothetical protein [Anaerolineales bacterium]